MNPRKETTRLEPHHRHLFLPIENSETGGCHIDIFLPEVTKDAPIAMMIHGGAWSIGGSDHLPPEQVTYLLEQGFAVVSPEYRLAPHVKLQDSLEDLVCAYRWVQAELNGHLGVELDTGRTCIMGWSAGGTGTVLLTDAILRNKLVCPRAILPTYPKTDNERGWSEPMRAFTEGITEEEKAKYEELLAQPVCTSYKITSATFSKTDPRMTWCKATMRTKTLNTWLCGQDAPYPKHLNPIDVVNSDFPPTLVIVATGDQLIDPAESYDLVNKLKSVGVDAKFLEARGMQHGFAEAERDAWPEDQDWWEEAILPGLEWLVKMTRA